MPLRENNGSHGQRTKIGQKVTLCPLSMSTALKRTDGEMGKKSFIHNLRCQLWDHSYFMGCS